LRDLVVVELIGTRETSKRLRHHPTEAGIDLTHGRDWVRGDGWLRCAVDGEHGYPAVAQDVEPHPAADRGGQAEAVTFRCVSAGRLRRDPYAKSPRRLEVALACEKAGARLARSGDIKAAAAMLDQALDGYEQLDAAREIGRTRAIQREHGIHRGQRGARKRAGYGWESLTPTEQTVSDLVSEAWRIRRSASGCSCRAEPCRLTWRTSSLSCSCRRAPSSPLRSPVGAGRAPHQPHAAYVLSASSSARRSPSQPVNGMGSRLPAGSRSVPATRWLGGDHRLLQDIAASPRPPHNMTAASPRLAR
jgi:hypothetical protein